AAIAGSSAAPLASRSAAGLPVQRRRRAGTSIAAVRANVIRESENGLLRARLAPGRARVPVRGSRARRERYDERQSEGGRRGDAGQEGGSRAAGRHRTHAPGPAGSCVGRSRIKSKRERPGGAMSTAAQPSCARGGYQSSERSSRRASRRDPAHAARLVTVAPPAAE